MKRFATALPLVLGLIATTWLGGCRADRPALWSTTLPDLPDELVATLDPDTLATRVATDVPLPERTATAAAPCCSSTNDMRLRVTFAYTKCGPLRDFIVGPRPDVATRASETTDRQGAPPSQLPLYRLRAIAGRTVLDDIVCVTGNGPWEATLTEQRSCAAYAPVHRLTFAPFGNLVAFTWNGGVQNHPVNIGLVSCRQTSRLEFPCNALSSCACSSSVCPPSEPCACNLQW